MRAICTILLSRNSPDDRSKAIGYVEQAISVLEEHSDQQEDNEFVGMRLLCVRHTNRCNRFILTMNVNGFWERRTTRVWSASSKLLHLAMLR